LWAGQVPATSLFPSGSKEAKPILWVGQVPATSLFFEAESLLRAGQVPAISLLPSGLEGGRVYIVGCPGTSNLSLAFGLRERPNLYCELAKYQQPLYFLRPSLYCRLAKYQQPLSCLRAQREADFFCLGGPQGKINGNINPP